MAMFASGHVLNHSVTSSGVGRRVWPSNEWLVFLFGGIGITENPSSRYLCGVQYFLAIKTSLNIIVNFKFWVLAFDFTKTLLTTCSVSASGRGA